MSKAKSGASLLVLVMALFIIPFLGSLFVIGSGYLLNAIIGIGLLQSSMIFAATLLTGVLAVGLTFITEELRWQRNHLSADDEDWDDDEEDSYEEDGEDDWQPSSIRLQSVQDIPKVGRNRPCPCGSKKKYKACCLGRMETQPDDIPF
jgi:hypothetical protein